MNVATDFDPRFDFSGYRTYDWLERTASKDDDPRVYNTIVTGRVKTAVNIALESKGFSRVAHDPPDFFVGWHGSIDKKMNAETINDDYGYQQAWGSANAPQPTSKTYVNEWEEGTLIIDIVDANTKQLVWRTTGMALIEDEKAPEEEQAGFNSVIAKMMQDFPPKL